MNEKTHEIIVPANLVLFSELCSLLEQLHKKKKHRKEQNKTLEKFVNEFRLNVGKTTGKKNSTFFPILRLLLPQCERERNAYNLKETKLGALLVKVLSLNKSSDTAQKLLNYRCNSNSTSESDFASVAYFVLKTRVGQTSSTLTIKDINEALNKIASSESGQKGHDIFTYLMKKLTATEFKWLLRIILKDLKLGISAHRILAAFHPDAPELFQNCNDIQKVCDEFDDGDARPIELGVELFYAISPMLSERLDITDVNQLSPNKVYQIEEKFDGERFQMHMDNGLFEYFSRRGHKYSQNYGRTFGSGLLTPYLKDCFKSNVKNFILDGEMMGWDKHKQCFGSKGLAYDIKKVTEASNYRPCYCVFDVLYYNGKSLIGAPEKGGLCLRERRKILDTMFDDIPGVIQISPRSIISNNSEILDGLNKAIDNQEEGVVVKDLDSYYIVNKRNAGWYKIKPEYTDGAMTDLDFVIVGADQAENKRHGRAKSFYIACADLKDGSVERWVCVGCVASGLTLEEKENICSHLEINWNDFKKKSPPSNIYFNKVKPDLWILPEHSIVLQIRATELIRSTDFGTEYTLRFPRVTTIRTDKPVNDIETLELFNQLISNRNPMEKLCTKRINESDIGEVGVKTRRTHAAKVVQVPEEFRTSSSGDTQIKSKALLDRKICILSEDTDCKKIDLVRIIESHGGKHVQNIGPDTWCSIVGFLSVRERELIATNKYDITNTSWLRELPVMDAPCTLQPLDMLSIKKDTRLKLCHSYDKYGDGYTLTTNKDTLKKCFEKMDKQCKIYLTNNEKLELDPELFDGDNLFSFLRPCVMHVQNPHLNLLARLYGAAVTEISPHLTHLVISSEISEEERKFMTLDNIKVVSEQWLEKCFENKRMVPELEYLIDHSGITQ